MHDAAILLREHPEAVPKRIEKLLSFQKSLEKEVEKLKAGIAMQSADWTEKEVKTIHGVKVLVKKVSVDNPAAMRDLADRFKEKIKSGIVILGSSDGSKALLIVVVTKDLTDRYHAGKIVNGIGSIVGGGGGGRPDMAQAGGSKMRWWKAVISFHPLYAFEYVNHAKGNAPRAVFHLFSQKNQRIEGPLGIDIPAVDVMRKFKSDRFVA